MTISAEVRDAATLALLRDTGHGLEVALLRRAAGHVFGAHAHVFPGGALDNADDAPDLAARCVGGSARARACLGHTGRALAYWMAAIRESFEEAGVLAGCTTAADAGQQAAERAALNAGHRDWLAVVMRLDLRFWPEQLVYFAYWQTPPGAPRRYATRFFAARAPAGQTLSCDGHETDLAWWVRPAEALARHARGEIKLMRPTAATLETLCGHADVDSALIALGAAHRHDP